MQKHEMSPEMSWVELKLLDRERTFDEGWERCRSEPVPLRFPNGAEFMVTYGVDVERLTSTYAELARDSEPRLILPGVVDDSRSTSFFKVTCVFGAVPDRVAVLGGWRGYLVSSSGEVLESWPLFLRDPRQSRETALWSLSLRPVGKGLLVDYEGGLLLLGADLGCTWHVPRHFFDRCVAIDGDSIRFVNDEDEQEETFVISVSDGIYTGPEKGRDRRLFLVFDGRTMVDVARVALDVRDRREGAVPKPKSGGS